MIKVIIERKLMPECAEQYDKQAMAVNQLVLSETGFVSSEALISTRDSNHRYVVVTFDNLHNWRQWYKSEKRKNSVMQILQMLEEPEKVITLEYQSRS